MSAIIDLVQSKLTLDRLASISASRSSPVGLISRTAPGIEPTDRPSKSSLLLTVGIILKIRPSYKSWNDRPVSNDACPYKSELF